MRDNRYYALVIVFLSLIGKVVLICISSNKYQQLVKACENCITISNEKFSSGDSFHSNPKSQMGTWIPLEQMNDLLSVLSDTSINHSSNIMKTIQHAHTPIVANLVKSEEFDLNIVKIPINASISSRIHSAGTILLYKTLDGESYIQSKNGNRIIQTDTINSNSSILRRMGGPSRSFIGSTHSSCVFIELALHPPKASSPNYIGGHGVYIDPDTSMESNDTILLNIPDSYLYAIFSSHITQLNLSQVRENTTDIPNISMSKENQFTNIRRQLGQNIGGLTIELDSLVRRILLTRMLSSNQLAPIGFSHVKGLLLYGPPGTGKTLIAREFAKKLNATSIKIVNGPEIIDKFVGEAERNIRNLFIDAEEEWKLQKEDSGLHVIIFDEIDAIAKPRGSLIGDGSGVRDSCVNQLLSKIDGIQEIRNILVIGLTNRKDLIDPALLRSGRLEVHIEINIPDEKGREEILAILLRPLVESKIIKLNDAVQWSCFFAKAKYTHGWTGADLAGFIRSATSFALSRYMRDVDKYPLSLSNYHQIEITDIIAAYEEVCKSVTPVRKPTLSRLSTLLKKINSIVMKRNNQESILMNSYNTFQYSSKEYIIDILQCKNT